VTSYGEEFAPKFGDKRTGCCVTTTHRLKLSLPSGIFFTKSNINNKLHLFPAILTLETVHTNGMGLLWG
jgi:hypothetical protein